MIIYASKTEDQAVKTDYNNLKTTQNKIRKIINTTRSPDTSGIMQFRILPG